MEQINRERLIELRAQMSEYKSAIKEEAQLKQSEKNRIKALASAVWSDVQQKYGADASAVIKESCRMGGFTNFFYVGDKTE
jgi:hypothetical protein